MVTKTWEYLEILTSSDLNTAFAECATKTGAETLTNKTLTSPTINGGTLVSPTITTPTINTPTITNKNSTGTDSGVETLVNKTLTSPVIAAMGSAFTIPAASSTPVANKMVNEAIVKAWADVGYDDTINSSYNVASAVRGTYGGSLAKYRVTFKRAFANTNYVVIPAYRYYQPIGVDGIAIVYEKATTYVDIVVWNISGLESAPGNFGFIAIGAQ